MVGEIIGRSVGSISISNFRSQIRLVRVVSGGSHKCMCLGSHETCSNRPTVNDFCTHLATTVLYVRVLRIPNRLPRKTNQMTT